MHSPLSSLAVAVPILLFAQSSMAQPKPLQDTNVGSTAGVPSITVYASRFEQTLTDALPHTRILTAFEIQKSGASNLSEVLSRVAGLPVRLNLDGSTNAVIDLKGFGDTASNNIVVLLDGVRLSEQEQTMARTSMIPLEAIDHVEITQTGNSVLYGDGANTGTINIVTRKNMGRLTVMTGGLASFAGYQSGLYHSQPLESSELSFFARQYASENYRKNSKGTEFSAGANWIKKIDAQSDMGARFFASRERNQLPGALPSVLLQRTPRDPQVPDYDWDANVDAHSLTLFGKWSVKDVQFAMDLNQRSRKNSDAYRYDAYDVYSGYHYDDWRQSYGNTSSQTHTRSASPRVKINDFLVADNVLQMGFDWLNTRKNGQAFLTFGCSSQSLASFCGNAGADAGGNTYQIEHQAKGLYFRNTLDVTAQDKFVLGFRRETYSQTRTIDYGGGPSTMSAHGTTHASEFEYIKNLQPNLTGYLRLGRHFRVANTDDNSNVLYAPGPIPLKVQTSSDLDIGLNYQSGAVTTMASFFRSDVNNEIGYDPSGCGYPCNVNYDPTRREGLNFSQKWAFSKAITLRSHLQYIHARFVEGTYEGKKIPGVSALSGNVSLDYQLGVRDQLTFTTRWAQSRYMSGDFENSQSKVPAYVVADVSYFYREKNWSFVAAIINLTDKKYSDTGIYKSSYTSPFNLTVYPNPGRSFSLTGRYAF